MEEPKTIGQAVDGVISEFKRAWKEGKGKTMKTVDAPADVIPVCPHCNNELTEVWKKEAPQQGHERYSLLLCPHCRKVLGTLNQHPQPTLF